MVVDIGIQLGETINKRSVDLSKTSLSGLFKELNGTCVLVNFYLDVCETSLYC